VPTTSAADKIPTDQASLDAVLGLILAVDSALQAIRTKGWQRDVLMGLATSIGRVLPRISERLIAIGRGSAIASFLAGLRTGRNRRGGAGLPALPAATLAGEPARPVRGGGARSITSRHLGNSRQAFTHLALDQRSGARDPGGGEEGRRHSRQRKDPDERCGLGRE
jgi:hypothetical protein